MQIPETPKTAEELDLMKRLAAYAEGAAGWDPGRAVGDAGKFACRTLHANICKITTEVLGPILDRVGAREMQSFTMHDRKHGLRVAHLMWHILERSRRERLTPPEIGLLVVSAFLHDLGMALSKEEREARLSDQSDLWKKFQVQEPAKTRMQELREAVGGADEVRARKAKGELDQMEEALLCQDTRERHATRERYNELLGMLREFHRRDPERIPSVDEGLSFGGDSFRDVLIDVCVSHNEDADALVRRNPENPARPRFPRSFPVGTEPVDLHMAAAALRLADILDFDRERTPAALYYYLIPTPDSPAENRSVLEWGKHMAISNWHIDSDAVVFRGRCQDHIIHHAIVQFCVLIQEEITTTRATFGDIGEEVLWPFALPTVVSADIHEEGYRYVPYRFELDDQRIYELLMGGAIYDNPLVAVRELVQNAVDACKLRDALTQLNEPYTPLTSERIFIRYEESDEKHMQPTLTVLDTGTGMDAFILERYFLRVGQSYYRSADFSRERLALQSKNLDFAPVSEFGIGFLSCFLLANRVEVETAMWEPLRGDARCRTLFIDGPTRLIRLDDRENVGTQRFKGTRVTLHLCRGGRRTKDSPPSWSEVEEYIRDVCQDLPYPLHLRHTVPAGVQEVTLERRPLVVSVPPYLEEVTVRIPVQDTEAGLEGEITLSDVARGAQIEDRMSKSGDFPKTGADPHLEFEEDWPGLRNRYTELFRGGFKVGSVPGLPSSYLQFQPARARLRLTWQSRSSRRYAPTNLARNSTSEVKALAHGVARIWIGFLIDHLDELPDSALYRLNPNLDFAELRWLENYDAYTLYRVAAKGWHAHLVRQGNISNLIK